MFLQVFLGVWIFTEQANADVPGALGTIRLFRNGVGDTNQSWSSGIVQIYASSQWGNICDDSSFGSDEADVICHQLGFTGASSYSNTGSTLQWGIDDSVPHIDSVSCLYSSYLTLAQCYFSTSPSSSCDNSRDVIITCESIRIWDSPSPGDIRLTNGTYSSDGLLEVYCNGQWGTVCDHSFYSTEARIACKQLGYNTHDNYTHLSQRGSSSQYVWLSTTTSCSTSDSNCLTSCGSCPIFADTGCSHSDDVTLECEYASAANYLSYPDSPVQTTDTCLNYNPDQRHASSGTIRFVRNSVPDTTQSWSSGIVEIFYMDQWGNICDDGSFGSDEADVICHQLGYTGASSYSNTGNNTVWGIDHSLAVMSDVHCATSSYLTLTQCSFNTNINSSCDNNNDVIVSCLNSSRIWDSPIAGDIRLSDGIYSSQGLLEVYCNGKWGRVCDSEFSSTKATRACEQLGYNYYDKYSNASEYGQVDAAAWFISPSSCSSSGDNCLTSCGSCPLGNPVSWCWNNVNLTCEYTQYRPKVNTGKDDNCYGFSTDSAPDGTVRLYRNGVPDTTQSWSSGIVEVQYMGQWGNICDDGSFGSDEADVICHQLGYTGASSYSNSGVTLTWGSDSSPTVMDSVSCSSSSYLTITQCSYSTDTYCDYSNDAIVACYPTRIWDSPSSGDIRLTGGMYLSQGLLEVYCNGEWGTVCSSQFSRAQGTAACKQLGYNDLYGVSSLSIGGSSNQSIWIKSFHLSCSSSAICLTGCGSCSSSPIAECIYPGDATLQCRYSSSFARVSSTTTSDCQNGADYTSTGTVRLYRNGVPDTSQSWSSGIVQVYYSYEWGNICDDSSFGSDEADVICHQLGYTGASSYSNTGSITALGTDSSPTVMDDVSCSSSSYLTITQCSFSTSISSSCTDSTDVTVSCYFTRIWSSPIVGDIRLTGGTYNNEGLLEVYCNGEWGTVCDDYFDSTDATVACKQLGYNYHTDYDHLNIRGDSSQSVWLHYLSGCSSFSDNCLASCGSCSSSRVTACTHSEDVTLSCEYKLYETASTAKISSDCFTSIRGVPTGTVRLYRNGTADRKQSWSSGIVQVYYDDQWGNICDDSSFGSNEADVICHQLGYTGASSYSNTGSTTIYTMDNSSTLMNDVSCSSFLYLAITQCYFSTITKFGCGNTNDVIVTCYSTRIWDSPSSGDIRLTGGTYSSQGLLEVYCNSQWITVCDDHFYNTHATVACRQLGYNGYLHYNQLPLQGTSSQSLRMRVGCSSYDSCLTQCSDCSSRSSSCGHNNDVTLECEYSLSYSKVDTDTSIDCDISTISESTIIGIATGSAIAFLVCIVCTVSIPICICVYLRVRVGTVGRSRGRPLTRVVSSSQPAYTSLKNASSDMEDEAVPFINNATDNTENDESHTETPIEQQSTIGPTSSGSVPPPTASGYPPPNILQPAVAPVQSTSHPASVVASGQNPASPQQPTTNTSHSTVYSHAY